MLLNETVINDMYPIFSVQMIFSKVWMNNQRLNSFSIQFFSGITGVGYGNNKALR